MALQKGGGRDEVGLAGWESAASMAAGGKAQSVPVFNGVEEGAVPVRTFIHHGKVEAASLMDHVVLWYN